MIESSNVKDWLQKLNIPKLIRIFSIIYLIFILLHFLASIAFNIEQSSTAIQYLSTILTSLSRTLIALTLWGVGQFLQIFRVQNEEDIQNY